MKLEDLEIYQLSIELGKKVWTKVYGWDYFTKDTLGKQLIRASNSVALNIAEGFGRYTYKETKQFSYYARGSLYEAKSCIEKAYHRKLIPEEEYQELLKAITNLGVKLNNYITSIRNKINHLINNKFQLNYY
jgi:four helix bundle protein